MTNNKCYLKYVYLSSVDLDKALFYPVEFTKVDLKMDICLSKNEREEIRIGLGALIRAKRQALDISQEELAFRSGLHRTYVGSVERGERNLSLENIFIFAKTLGCHPRELIPEVPVQKTKKAKQ